MARWLFPKKLRIVAATAQIKIPLNVSITAQAKPNKGNALGKQAK